MQLDVMADYACVCWAKGRSSDLVVCCTVRRVIILNEVNRVIAILNKENVYRTDFFFWENLVLESPYTATEYYLVVLSANL